MADEQVSGPDPEATGTTQHPDDDGGIPPAPPSEPGSGPESTEQPPTAVVQPAPFPFSWRVRPYAGALRFEFDTPQGQNQGLFIPLDTAMEIAEGIATTVPIAQEMLVQAQAQIAHAQREEARRQRLHMATTDDVRRVNGRRFPGAN